MKVVTKDPSNFNVNESMRILNLLKSKGPLSYINLMAKRGDYYGITYVKAKYLIKHDFLKITKKGKTPWNPILALTPRGKIYLKFLEQLREITELRTKLDFRGSTIRIPIDWRIKND